MVQSSHTPTVLTNPHQPDNPILFANDAFLRLTGYGGDEVLGRNCRFLSGPETDREVSNEVRCAVEAAEPVSVKILNYRRDSSRFWNQLHISPIFDESGILAYFVGYQHDITQQVEAEQALRQARQELEQRVTEREGLIREVHHRVRNNLQTIIGLLNLEARRGDPLLRRQFDLITQESTKNRGRCSRRGGRLHAQAVRYFQVIWPADLHRTDPSCLTSHGSWCSPYRGPEAGLCPDHADQWQLPGSDGPVKETVVMIVVAASRPARAPR
jgi:PAS domain S-box-containing protein